MEVTVSIWTYVDGGNWSPPSAAYMHLWISSALVQVMACRLSNQCWLIANWILKNKLQWNLNRNKKLFIHEYAYENVSCEMEAILSGGNALSNIIWHH